MQFTTCNGEGCWMCDQRGRVCDVCGEPETQCQCDDFADNADEDATKD
jgi:hypothetical protein